MRRHTVTITGANRTELTLWVDDCYQRVLDARGVR
jgi:hypothetical protein